MPASSRKAKKALTPKQIAEKELRKEAQKQRRRIRQFVRRAEARGYTFPSDVVPDLPKRVTEQTLARLKRQTPEKLYKKAVYTSPEGTTIKASKRRAAERSEASRRAAETRKARMRSGYYDRQKDRKQAEPTTEPEVKEATLTLAILRKYLREWDVDSRWSPEFTELKTNDKNRLENALNAAIRMNGETKVAQNIQDNAEELTTIINNILYESGNAYKEMGRDGINKDLNRFMAILLNRPLTIKESMEFSQFGEVE